MSTKFNNILLLLFLLIGPHLFQLPYIYIIIFRSPLLKQNVSDLSISVGDTHVSPSSKVRDLGVVFDQYLTFHDHISGICKSTHFHALITTRLDYSNRILHNLQNKQIERLQRIQNQAARMLKRIPRRNHITPRFERVALVKNS